ncbi:MAG: hypothetical protein AB8B82_10030 [Roseovarius sp.]
MTLKYNDIALGTVLGWMVWYVLSAGVAMPVSLIIAMVVGGLTMRFARHTLPVRGVMAVLDPIGIVLPILILWQVLGALGLPLAPFSALELIIFVIVYAAFLATAFGVIPVDLYRYGYHALPVAGIALVLCLYAVITGTWIVAVIAVAGQAMWVFKQGSSNYFDHILHATLVPVAVIALVARLIG